MFQAPSRQFRGYARYQAIDRSARVEGASPHALIAILFDELLKALDTMAAADRGGDTARVHAEQARAMSLLHGLEDGLDFERGGEIAKQLAVIYREARRLIGVGADERQDAITQTREMIADIAGAWTAIG